MSERIGLDARLWDHPGIGRYLRELFFAMQAKGGRFHLLARPEVGEELRKKKLDVELRPASSKIYSLAEQWELAAFARTAPLLHVPHFNVPIGGAKKLVVTVHDLIYLKGDEHSGSALGRAYVRFLFKRIEKKADAVITVSEFTKNDLLETFPGLRDRVTVTYEAASPSLKPATEIQIAAMRERFGLSKPFVLFVGSLKRHKNLPALIGAMRRMKERGLPHELVLAGRRDPKEKELEALIAKNADLVRRLGEVSEDSLAPLYSAADAFVLPSFWEGFGLPVLEAMACGAPVLASSRASLPEVVGTAGRTFDPDRVDALNELLYNVLNDRDLRQKMKADGFVQAQRFSWDKTAEATLEVYRQVLR